MRGARSASSSCSFSCFVEGRSPCVLMYFSIVSALTAPTEATKNVKELHL
ncbi:hypothetical protein OHA27_36090 [Streptomyces sp. NBC_01619]|nr:hypothetical protein [Streptomyces sp. NBC_01619]MCX4515630.1 hypothetical protein [Streptomyces sp. NBC_01619]